MPKGPPPKPFWECVQIGAENECWPWRENTDKQGYGIRNRIIDGVRYQRMHRLAYRLHYGVHPGKLVVMHTCDNPPCCNPAHLRLGTVADNTADMVAKGRQARTSGDAHWTHHQPERVVRGERHYAYGRPGRRGLDHPSAKLTDDQVREIRERYAAGGVYQRELAEEYGVSKGHINAVILRRFRAHVD